jgi:hypothetical protein
MVTNNSDIYIFSSFKAVTKGELFISFFKRFFSILFYFVQNCLNEAIKIFISS